LGGENQEITDAGNDTGSAYTGRKPFSGKVTTMSANRIERIAIHGKNYICKSTTTSNGNTTPAVIRYLTALMTIFVIGCAIEKNNLAGPGIVDHDTWPQLSVASETSFSRHIQAELLSDNLLHEGYDSLAAVLRDSETGKTITDARVQWFPLMDMGTMKHSSPVDDFSASAFDDSLFRNGILFSMPSESSLVNGGWTLRLRINDHRFTGTGDYNDSIDFHVWVKGATFSPTVWWKGTDSLWRVAALLAPKKAVSGSNALELFIARKATAMSWPKDSSWKVTFIPTMPSMGHSSPNNVNPSHVGDAHYKGTVNFTMTGDWRLTFSFAANDNDFVSNDTNQYLDVKVQ
jgi:hypothetical protein